MHILLAKCREILYYFLFEIIIGKFLSILRTRSDHPPLQHGGKNQSRSPWLNLRTVFHVQLVFAALALVENSRRHPSCFVYTHPASGMWWEFWLGRFLLANPMEFFCYPVTFYGVVSNRHGVVRLTDVRHVWEGTVFIEIVFINRW